MDFGNFPIPVPDRVDEAFSSFEHHNLMLKFHIDYLDDYCVGIGKHDLILLGAETGAGKTALAKRIAQRNAKLGKRVFYFALEAEPGEIETRIGYELIMSYAKAAGNIPRGASYGRWMARTYEDHPDFGEYQERAKEELRRDYGTLHTFYKRGDFSYWDVNKEFLAVHAGADLIVLDHLHYVDLGEGSENAEYKKTIKLIRDLALEMATPVLVVAHLRKKERGRPSVVPCVEDFHGSSDLIKIATKCILLAPAYRDDMPKGMGGTYFYVGKDRRIGTTNYVALLGYDLALCDYAPGYELGKKDFIGAKWEKCKLMDIPAWADRAIAPKMLTVAAKTPYGDW